MAISQLHTNHSQDIHGHARAFNVGENLDWGRSNPFSACYDWEKPRYQASETEYIDHYLNVVNPNYKYMGMAKTASKQWGSATGQVYELSGGKLHTKNAITVEEYTAKFNKYYNRVMTELREAK